MAAQFRRQRAAPLPVSTVLHAPVRAEDAAFASKDEVRGRARPAKRTPVRLDQISVFPRKMVASGGGIARSGSLPHLDRERPRLLIELLAFVDRELSTRKAQPHDQEGASAVRLSVWREALRLFTEAFITYRPLLDGVQREYDAHMRALQERLEVRACRVPRARHQRHTRPCAHAWRSSLEIRRARRRRPRRGRNSSALSSAPPRRSKRCRRALTAAAAHVHQIPARRSAVLRRVPSAAPTTTIRHAGAARRARVGVARRRRALHPPARRVDAM